MYDIQNRSEDYVKPKWSGTKESLFQYVENGRTLGDIHRYKSRIKGTLRVMSLHHFCCESFCCKLKIQSVILGHSEIPTRETNTGFLRLVKTIQNKRRRARDCVTAYIKYIKHYKHYILGVSRTSVGNTFTDLRSATAIRLFFSTRSRRSPLLTKLPQKRIDVAFVVVVIVVQVHV